MNTIRVLTPTSNKITEPRPQYRGILAGDLVHFRSTRGDLAGVVTSVTRMGPAMGSVHVFVHTSPGDVLSCYAFDLGCTGFHRVREVQDPIKRESLLEAASRAYMEQLAEHRIWRERFARGETICW